MGEGGRSFCAVRTTPTALPPPTHSSAYSLDRDTLPGLFRCCNLYASVRFYVSNLSIAFCRFRLPLILMLVASQFAGAAALILKSRITSVCFEGLIGVWWGSTSTLRPLARF